MCNICKVEGCPNKVVAKGLCSKHYTQLRRYGKIFKWTVQITLNNKTKYIGRYEKLEDAIAARKEAAKKYYGEFANED